MPARPEFSVYEASEAGRDTFIYIELFTRNTSTSVGSRAPHSKKKSTEKAICHMHGKVSW